MKKRYSLLILACLLPFGSFAVPTETDEGSSLSTDSSKMDWWQEAKFGLFIHWGPSSVAGVEISWARETHPFDHLGKMNNVPDEVYDALYKEFNPLNFDADELVRTAKEAGMKYLVFTAKHHDGFSMWPTKHSDYNIMNTPFKRDICGELAEACRKHGLKLGWYYSTRDWYHPDYLVGDNSKYNDFYHGQIRELLTNYGEVSVLWFDHVAGTWDDYRFQELFDMIYELQPGIIVNNRAAKFIKRRDAETPTPELQELTKGDFQTPEGKVGVFLKDFPWETCMPMSKGPDGHGGWSYRPESVTASFEKCAEMLAACVTGCGNMLLNVGPMADGSLRPSELANLEDFKPWIETFGESLYGTEGGPYISGQWGGSCIKGNALYLHVFKWKDGMLKLPPLPRKVLGCEELGGEAVGFEQNDSELLIKLQKGKTRSLHSVVKLVLAEGPDMALINVEGATEKEQHGSLVNPMASKPSEK
jgi:alpha-L-fucosidase